MSNNQYQAGVVRADITPPLGIRLSGYAVREGLSHGVDAPLTLTALALRGSGTTVMIVAVDVVLMTVQFADSLRECCGQAAGIAPAHVLVNCNHTHASPATDGYMGFDTPDQLAMQADFRRLILEAGASASRAAVAALRPARVAVGWGECRGNINRRQKTPDGQVITGEDASAPCDHSVGVIRVDDLHGQPIAVAFRYSCHTVTLGPKTNVISPDFAGPARTVIETHLGCPSLFLQGCAGNINPASGIGQDAESREDTLRLGHMLGGEVLKVAENLRTHRRRAEPKLIKSVAWYWLYETEPSPAGPEGRIRVRETRMTLPLTPFPDLAEVEKERAEWDDKLTQARAKAERDWVVAPLLRFATWAQRRHDAAHRGPNPLPVTFPVQTIEMDELTLVALPFEPMTETGLALREAIGVNTFVLGYSNGIVAYLPTPAISGEGGMEARLGYKAYLLPSAIPGEWEPQIQQRALDLLSGKGMEAKE